MRPADVTRIIRVSRARPEAGPPMETLFAARKRVRQGGSVPGLCGAVLHVSGWYVLWHEGTGEAVAQALRLSGQRGREPLRLIHRSTGPGCLREPLSISMTQWPETAGQFEWRIEALREAADRLAPAQIWRALSEPSESGGARAQAGRPAWVALLASDDQSALEVVRRIAHRSGHPLVYRRFAGGDPGTPDVGTAYLDLAFRGRRVRVQAVARRAFHHDLLCHSLGAPDRVALLVGDRARDAVDLTHGLTRFLRGTAAAAEAEAMAIDVFGCCPPVAQEVSRLLREEAGAAVTNRRTFSDIELLELLLQPKVPQACGVGA